MESSVSQVLAGETAKSTSTPLSFFPSVSFFLSSEYKEFNSRFPSPPFIFLPLKNRNPRFTFAVLASVLVKDSNHLILQFRFLLLLPHAAPFSCCCCCYFHLLFDAFRSFIFSKFPEQIKPTLVYVCAEMRASSAHLDRGGAEPSRLGVAPTFYDGVSMRGGWSTGCVREVHRSSGHQS